MLITKADGTVEEFNAHKLEHSLRRAGAHDNEVKEIVRKIEGALKEGMTTGEIYHHAFNLLRRDQKTTAARYSLRRALFDLGPTGFPFEDFLGRLFTEEGYTVKVGQIIQGKCALHEIDLSAFNHGESFVAEAKFHARPGIKSDLQVVLYSYARFLDLQQRPICVEDKCGIDSLLVVTNTKFTHTAINYAKCTGLKLLSWSYPKGATLQERVEKARLYPITALSALSVADKRMLLTSNIILCRDMLNDPQILNKFNIKQTKVNAALEEARQLCAA